MFIFKPESFYMMPFHFGSRAQKGSALYGDVTTIAVSYLTDRQKLSEYLPEPFEVGAEPLVSVSYAMNREVAWLAGGGYNLIGVNVSAVFKGKIDHLSGSYCLVMWENLTDPILTGREIQGIPKIYAEIPDHTIFNGIWSTCASYRGHKILDLKLKDLNPLPSDRVKEIEKMSREGNWMGWKYIPNTGGPGAEVSHATLFPTNATFDLAWSGTGEVKWNRLTWEENPTQFHIVNALEELPILEYRSAVVLKGSSNLAVISKPVRPIY
jgi:Acetoacetate decarboxylase (ADC)